MNQIGKFFPEELNSSSDFDELNKEIHKFVSESSWNEDSTIDYDCNFLNEIEDEIQRDIIESPLLIRSPIWNNTPPQLYSPNSSCATLKSLNASYYSNTAIPSLPSPINFKPKAANVANYISTLYSMQRSMKDKYETIFNSSQECAYVPHLDNENNMIHLFDIFSGKEQRTTLMIRHIPNKYTLKLFTDEINQMFFNKYDVFYLPIDYSNNCNLGFAFINFVNPMHIIDFYETYRGKKWNKYLSDKRCELAFAKIQGKQNLITHFEKGNVLHHQTIEKKPIILYTPNPLPNISLSYKYEDALREYYPYVSYFIDQKHKCLSMNNFYPYSL